MPTTTHHDRLDAAAVATADVVLRLIVEKDMSRTEAIAAVARSTETSAAEVDALLDRACLVFAAHARGEQ